MHYLKRLTRKNGEDAVSPVVGVMLMLVVTIIIAAVVSGFSGGLIGNTHKAPTIQMDVKIANSGSWYGSGFYATVHGVSEPIATKNLKLITSWSTTNSTDNTAVVGGNTSIGGVTNSWFYITQQQNKVISQIVPWGYGVGITNVSTAQNQDSDPVQYAGQQFGNYSLMQGTSMVAQPEGASGPGLATMVSSLAGGYGVVTPYTYTYDSGTYGGPSVGQIDPAQAVLGVGWENLKPGDTVTVKLIYIPTGQTIFSKDVAVTGA
jgi:FlaG/FlaF family flagellin (archaellin)